MEPKTDKLVPFTYVLNIDVPQNSQAVGTLRLDDSPFLLTEISATDSNDNNTHARQLNSFTISVATSAGINLTNAPVDRNNFCGVLPHSAKAESVAITWPKKTELVFTVTDKVNAAKRVQLALKGYKKF